MPVPANHVIVKFNPAIPGHVQGIAMLEMERHLRKLGYPVEVFKETMADDSRLRREMTQEQRDKL